MPSERAHHFHHADAPTGRAMRALLLHLLQVMETNLPGTIDNLDPEFLHDFRVAIRRTRSVLAQLKHVFSTEEIRPFQEQFKRLANLTGPTRDLDVYLITFSLYHQSLSTEARSDLDPFLEFLQQRHTLEQGKLASELGSANTRKLLNKWRIFLETSPTGSLQASKATTPIIEVVRPRIWKLYTRFIEQGRAITLSSPDEQVHELRITGKKLRYLIEYSQELFPAKHVGQLVKATKNMQDFLGEINDLKVQQAQLLEFSRLMQAEYDPPASTLVAMGRLVEVLAQKQQQMRKTFPDRFAEFDRGKLQHLFEELFSPKG